MFRNLKLRRPLAVFDLETTGVDTKMDRIVEISILTVRPGRPADQHTCRVNPGVPIPPGATAVHGITDTDVARKPRFEDVADDLLARFDGCDLCGYNLKRFDLQLLYNEFRRAGRACSLDGRAVIDPQEIFHTYEPRDLTAAVRFYLGQEHAGAHTAAADVLATAAILDAMLARYTDLKRDTEGLHAQFMDRDAVDSAGFFKRVAGEIRFVKGKHRGQPLDFVARTSPDYLQWMLGQDFFEDTKAVARDALRQRGARTTV
jgi:DNA polymerase III subunit epsilon